MFCKYCGENNVDGAKFCKNCGKPLMTTSSADGTAAGYNPEMTPGYTPTSQQNHKKTGIYAATDNRRLIQLLNNLREQMYRYRIEYLKKKECYPQLLEEHQTIIDSIESRDKDRATQITGQHIKNQAEAVVDTIREKEESI